MALIGKTEGRLAFVVFVTATLPLAVALLLANSLFSQASAIWFNPEVGEQLDRGVDVYKDYVKAIKDDMRHQTDAIAEDEVLREAAKKHNSELVEAQLDALFPRFPELVDLRIVDADGNILAKRDRGKPVDEATERSLEVTRPLSDDPDAPMAAATFAIDRKRLDELETTGNVVTKYHQLEASALRPLSRLPLRVRGAARHHDAAHAPPRNHAPARGVTKRINRLAGAIEKVAEGDLSVRVPVTGSDELTELARTFNRMLGEMAQSRTRIEFLQRMGAWQEMAQRLAHEIKNPLTPIQLAVQECHKKYTGDDPPLSKLARYDARNRRRRGRHVAAARHELFEFREVAARRAERRKPPRISARLLAAARASRGRIGRRGRARSRQRRRHVAIAGRRADGANRQANAPPRDREFGAQLGASDPQRAPLDRLFARPPKRRSGRPARPRSRQRKKGRRRRRHRRGRRRPRRPQRSAQSRFRPVFHDENRRQRSRSRHRQKNRRRARRHHRRRKKHRSRRRALRHAPAARSHDGIAPDAPKSQSVLSKTA